MTGKRLNPAYLILYIGFTAAPLLAGLDKFFNFLGPWHTYLAPSIAFMLPFDEHVFMRIVGGIEIFASILVAVKPKIGGFVVSGWLVLIIINLILSKAYYDIALRDAGLSLGALALALLSREECKYV